MALVTTQNRPRCFFAGCGKAQSYYKCKPEAFSTTGCLCWFVHDAAFDCELAVNRPLRNRRRFTTDEGRPRRVLRDMVAVRCCLGKFISVVLSPHCRRQRAAPGPGRRCFQEPAIRIYTENTDFGVPCSPSTPLRDIWGGIGCVDPVFEVCWARGQLLHCVISKTLPKRWPPSVLTSCSPEHHSPGRQRQIPVAVLFTCQCITHKHSPLEHTASQLQRLVEWSRQRNRLACP